MDVVMEIGGDLLSRTIRCVNCKCKIKVIHTYIKLKPSEYICKLCKIKYNININDL